MNLFEEIESVKAELPKAKTLTRTFRKFSWKCTYQADGKSTTCSSGCHSRRNTWIL